jgi:hypothetical protein
MISELKSKVKTQKSKVQVSRVAGSRTISKYRAGKSKKFLSFNFWLVVLPFDFLLLT